jgi:hypothetical protein
MERRVWRLASGAGAGSNARLLWGANVRRGAAQIGRRPSSDQGACPGFRLPSLFLRVFVSLPTLDWPMPMPMPMTMQTEQRVPCCMAVALLEHPVGLIDATAVPVGVCSAASCRGCKGWSQTTACTLPCAPSGACARQGLRTVDLTISGRWASTVGLFGLTCSHLRSHPWSRAKTESRRRYVACDDVWALWILWIL